MSNSTADACRSEEFCRPELVDRNTYEQWIELGRPDMYSAARRKITELLDAPLKNPLPDKVIGRLGEILRKADEELLN